MALDPTPGRRVSSKKKKEAARKRAGVSTFTPRADTGADKAQVARVQARPPVVAEPAAGKAAIPAQNRAREAYSFVQAQAATKTRYQDVVRGAQRRMADDPFLGRPSPGPGATQPWARAVDTGISHGVGFGAGIASFIPGPWQFPAGLAFGAYTLGDPAMKQQYEEAKAKLGKGSKKQQARAALDFALITGAGVGSLTGPIGPGSRGAFGARSPDDLAGGGRPSKGRPKKVTEVKVRASVGTPGGFRHDPERIAIIYNNKTDEMLVQDMTGGRGVFHDDLVDAYDQQKTPSTPRFFGESHWDNPDVARSVVVYPIPGSREAPIRNIATGQIDVGNIKGLSPKLVRELQERWPHLPIYGVDEGGNWKLYKQPKPPKVKVHEVDVPEEDLGGPTLARGREDFWRRALLYHTKTGDLLVQGEGSTHGPWHGDLRTSYESQTGNKFVHGGETPGDVLSIRVFNDPRDPRNPGVFVDADVENIPQELVDAFRQRYPGLQIFGRGDRPKLTAAQVKADARRAKKKPGPSQPQRPPEDRRPSRSSDPGVLRGPIDRPPDQPPQGPFQVGGKWYDPEGFEVPAQAPPMTRNDQYQTDWRPPSDGVRPSELPGMERPGGIMGRASQRYEEFLNDIETGRVNNEAHFNERTGELQLTQEQYTEALRRYNAQRNDVFQDQIARLAEDMQNGQVTRSQLERRMDEMDMTPSERDVFRRGFDRLVHQPDYEALDDLLAQIGSGERPLNVDRIVEGIENGRLNRQILDEWLTQVRMTPSEKEKVRRLFDDAEQWVRNRDQHLMDEAVDELETMVNPPEGPREASGPNYIGIDRFDRPVNVGDTVRYAGKLWQATREGIEIEGAQGNIIDSMSWDQVGASNVSVVRGRGQIPGAAELRKEMIDGFKMEIQGGLTRSQLERRMDEEGLNSASKQELREHYDAWENARRNPQGAGGLTPSEQASMDDLMRHRTEAARIRILIDEGRLTRSQLEREMNQTDLTPSEKDGLIRYFERGPGPSVPPLNVHRIGEEGRPSQQPAGRPSDPRGPPPSQDTEEAAAWREYHEATRPSKQPPRPSVLDRIWANIERGMYTRSDLNRLMDDMNVSPSVREQFEHRFDEVNEPSPDTDWEGKLTDEFFQRAGYEDAEDALRSLEAGELPPRSRRPSQPGAEDVLSGETPPPAAHRNKRGETPSEEQARRKATHDESMAFLDDPEFQKMVDEAGGAGGEPPSKPPPTKWGFADDQPDPEEMWRQVNNLKRPTKEEIEADPSKGFFPIYINQKTRETIVGGPHHTHEDLEILLPEGRSNWVRATGHFNKRAQVMRVIFSEEAGEIKAGVRNRALAESRRAYKAKKPTEAAGGGKEPPPPPPKKTHADFPEDADPWDVFLGTQGPPGVTPKHVAEEVRTNNALELLNLPRTIKSAYDISFPLRQAIVMMAAHPVLWAKAWPPMIKALLSEEAAAKLSAQITSQPSYEQASKYVAFVDLSDDLARREEGFHGMKYGKHVPGVKSTSRAYNQFANTARWLMWQELIKTAQKAGHSTAGYTDDSKFLLESMGKWVNAATGRGNLRGTGDIHALANGLLFSPRLMASRVQLLNPLSYTGVKGTRYKGLGHSFVRKQAAIGMLKLIAEVSAVGAIVAKATGADVELDPRSADFMKLKFGDTRVDLTGGFQPYIVLASRLSTNQTKNQHGQVVDLGPGYNQRSGWEALLDFGENKASPLAGAFADVTKREIGMGEPWEIKRAIYELFAPINLANTGEVLVKDPRLWPPSASLEDPKAAAGTLVGGSVGLGVDTYKVTSEPKKTEQQRLGINIRKDMLKERRLAKKRGWDDVPPHIRSAVTLKHQVEARLASFEKTLKKQPSAQVPKGDRLKLTERQRAMAVVNALRDFNAPNFNYEAERRHIMSLSEKGMDNYQQALRRRYYSDTLEGWHANAN